VPDVSYVVMRQASSGDVTVDITESAASLLDHREHGLRRSRSPAVAFASSKRAPSGGGSRAVIG
jgi:hypothetical protein